MKTFLLGSLVLLGLAAPASAHVSIAVGLPGFAFLAAGPYLAPPPVVVVPSPDYPGFYARPPVFYSVAPRRRGCHRGRWRHGRRWDD